MADSVEMDLVIRALSEGFDKLSGDLDKLGKSTEAPAEPAKKTSLSFTELKSALDLVSGAAKTAGAAFDAAFDFTKLGATVVQTEDSFNNLIDAIDAAPDLLNQLKDAAGGTIDDLSLMSSTATLLAGTSGDLATNLANATPQLLEIARAANKLNPSLGDTAFLYESISKGIKRASPLILDNLGIVVKVGEANKIYAEQLGKSVKELTAAEKQQALLNATLKSGKTLIEQAGGAANNAVDPFNAFTTSVTNLKNASAALVTESGLMQATLEGLGDNADGVTMVMDAQRKGVISTSDAWRLFAMLQVPSTMQEALDEITKTVTEQEREVARLTNVYNSAQDATVEWAENTFYAEQAQAALNAQVETAPGSLFGLKSAIAEVAENIDFWKSASGLLNTALKSQAETESELNERQIELLYVTGQITEAQKAQYLAANEQIQKLEQLNKLLDAGYVSWEQYLAIVADGKVTTEEMGDAVAEVAGPLLDANLASDTQMWNDMGESIGDVGNNAAQAVASFDLVKQKMLETGKGLEFVTQNAGPFQGAMETTNEVLGTTVVTAEQASLMVGNLASAAQAAAGNYNIHFNITSTGQIPQLGSSADVTQKSGENAVGLAGGADFIVPPGYPNDSYGPIYVQSGEHVQVTPAGQAQGGGSSAPPIVQVFLDSQQIAAIVRVQQGQDYRQRTGGGYRP